jgi:hypothetical protein
MLTVKRPIEGTRTGQALGWNVFKLGNNEILAHDGGTFGFQARFIVERRENAPLLCGSTDAAKSR